VIYKTNYAETLRSPNISTVVKELNAAVLTKTFPGKGIHKADLYTSKNSCDMLVLHGSCAPINDTFVKTVEIEL
jgi:hypothetical protein